MFPKTQSASEIANETTSIRRDWSKQASYTCSHVGITGTLAVYTINPQLISTSVHLV